MLFMHIMSKGDHTHDITREISVIMYEKSILNKYVLSELHVGPNEFLYNYLDLHMHTIDILYRL
jgi:hypothetical protein